jgi:acyl-CoA thioester hydrolase
MPLPALPSADVDRVLFRWPLRVYWEDTDAGGIVFYANYLKFFERARTEWLRSLGVQQQALREGAGAIFVVADTAVRFHAPAQLDDAIEVTVAVLGRGSASLRLRQQAWRGSTLLAAGDIRIGCVDQTSLRPCRMPSLVQLALETPTTLPAPHP